MKSTPGPEPSVPLGDCVFAGGGVQYLANICFKHASNLLLEKEVGII